MRQNVFTKTTRLLIAATMITVASGAAAKEMPVNGNIEPGLNPLQIAPLALSGIDTEITVKFDTLPEAFFKKMLDERTAYLQETRPLVQDLKTKWATLTGEFSKQTPEEAVTTRLQTEILKLDAQLAEKRLQHVLALTEIKTSQTAGSDYRLLASR